MKTWRFGWKQVNLLIFIFIKLSLLRYILSFLVISLLDLHILTLTNEFIWKYDDAFLIGFSN